MKTQISILTSLVAAAFLVGCGGSGVSSGVDGSKVGSELTEEEVKDVCLAVEAYAADSITKADACKLAGVIAYGLASADESLDPVETCEAAVTACNDSDEDVTDVESSCNNIPAGATEGCESTVAEVEACQTDLIDAQAEAFKSIPGCDAAGDAEPPSGESSLPESCDTVAEKCPIILAL